MTDNVPVSRTHGPATREAAQAADAVSDGGARHVDRASLGAAFPRTDNMLTLEFGDRADFR